MRRYRGGKLVLARFYSNNMVRKLPMDVDYTTTDHGYIKFLADNLEELGPYPTYSKYVNPLHFYQNPVMAAWSSKKAHPVSLRQLANFGKKLTKEKVLSSANFVRLEIPIRISKKLRELQVLPFAAISNHHLVQIYESYYKLFEEFRRIKPITTLAENEEYCVVLSQMLTQHLRSLPHLILGALECRILNSMPQTQLDAFMSGMLRARISRRLIVEEHLSLTDKFSNTQENVDKPELDYIGDVFYRCSAVENLHFCGETIAKNYVAGLFPEGFLMPELVIEGSDVRFQFMDTHLQYIFGEILRNSYENTMKNFILTHSHEKTQFFAENRPPPIKVTIISTNNTVSFRFSDRGGGIKNTSIHDIWSFGKNERLARDSLRNFHKLPGLKLNEEIDLVEPTAALHKTSLAGHTHSERYLHFKNNESSLRNLIKRPSNLKLNLGLAMCKVYAEYWNGDIVMNSLENFGTDTYLTFQKLGTNDELKLDKA